MYTRWEVFTRAMTRKYFSISLHLDRACSDYAQRRAARDKSAVRGGRNKK